MPPEKNTAYREVSRHCFINAPFAQLQTGLLDLFQTHRLQPEIGLEGDCLWSADTDDFRKLAAVLEQNELACTLHAPFFDLAPGGLDPRILEVTREKLRRAFDLIAVFRPKSVVCHLGYEENKHSYKMDTWLDTAVETWSRLLETAAGTSTPVMFENTYETSPEIHSLLFTKLSGADVGFCLDVGHLSAYAGTGWQPWTAELLPYLRQLHLHDNHGERDEHIGVGEGCFDFQGLFGFLRDHKVAPLITLEPHSEEDLWLSLQNMAAMNLFS